MTHRQAFKEIGPQHPAEGDKVHMLFHLHLSVFLVDTSRILNGHIGHGHPGIGAIANTEILGEGLAELGQVGLHPWRPAYRQKALYVLAAW